MLRRMRRMSFAPRPRRSVDSNVIVPDVGSIRRRMQRPTVVFPDPDSPTRPSVSPGATSKLTPSTALTCATVRASTPLFTGKYFVRSWTERRGCVLIAIPASRNAECRRQKAEGRGTFLHSAFCILHSSSSHPLRIRQVPVQVATRGVSLAHRHQRRLVAVADLHHIGAARIDR